MYTALITTTLGFLSFSWTSAIQCGQERNVVDTARANEDLIVSLPGLEVDPPFRQYSGYLPGIGTRRLHYWLIESEGSVADDPLVIWFNGGPGCSSLTGLLEGNGPFRVAKDGRTLKWNPHRWNKLATMLYIESPAGTGFSFSTDANYTSSDDDARDNKYAAILKFFERFPRFADNDLYVFGQSWGGVYVPMLADLLVTNSDINLKGIGIGNGYLDMSYRDNSFPFFGYSHGSINDSTWFQMKRDCCSDSKQQSDENYFCEFSSCTSQFHVYDAFVSGMNPYDVNARCATGTRMHTEFNQQGKPISERALGMGYLCVNSTATIVYLNQESVRHALHIPSELPGMKEWYMCGVNTRYEYSNDVSMRPYLQRILQTKTPVLLYYGTADLMCNFFGARWFVDSLNLQMTAGQQPWFFTDELGFEQIGGFITRYDYLDFITVLGASHMVPKDHGRQAFEIFQTYLGHRH